MFMWIGFAMFCLVAILWLVTAAAAERGLRKSGYQSLTRYAAYIQFMQDKRELNRLGIAQQLKRAFGPFAAFGISFNSMPLLGGAAVYFSYAWNLENAWVLVLGWPLLGLCALAIQAFQAELMSAVPSAGGSYHAALLLGGKRRGYMAGWMQLGGGIALLAFINLTASRWIFGAVFASSSLSPGIGVMLIFVVLSLMQLCFCFVSNYGFSIMQKGSAMLQIAALLALIGAIAYYLWPSFDYERLFDSRHAVNLGAETAHSEGWLAGLLLLYRIFFGSGAAEHMAEETIEPRIRLPWGQMLSGAYIYAGGFVLLSLCAMILAGNHTGVTSSVSSLEAALMPWSGAVHWRVLISVGAAVSLFTSGVSVLFATSRLVGSLARDEALPFSKPLGKVHRKHRTFAAGASLCAAGAALLTGAASIWLPDGAVRGGLVLLALAILLQHGALLVPLLLSISPAGRERLNALQPLWTLGSARKIIGPAAAVALIGLMAASALAAPAALSAAGLWLLVAAAWYAIGRRTRYEGLAKGLSRPYEELLLAERYHPQ